MLFVVIFVEGALSWLCESGINPNACSIYTVKLRCSVDYQSVAHADRTATWGRRKLQFISHRVRQNNSLPRIHFTHRYRSRIYAFLPALRSLFFCSHK
jgi:hypothetical protein